MSLVNTKKHDRSADGLRGIAALNVAIFHFFAFFYPYLIKKNYPSATNYDVPSLELLDIIRFPLFNIFYNGQFAVLTFFVISGYVLTLPHYFGRPDLIPRRFYGRYLRLNLPCAVAILVSYLIISNDLNFAHEARTLAGRATDPTIISHLTFWDALKEMVYGAVILAHSEFNVPLWTIGVEFIGSLLVLSLFFPKSKKKIWIILGVIILGALVYTNSVTYLLAILLGSQIYRVKLDGYQITLIGIIGIYLGGYQYNSIYYDFLQVETWGSKNIMNSVGALFLTTAVINGFSKRLVLSGFAQFLGRISFPLYIIHYILLSSAFSYTYLHLGTGLPERIAHFVIYFVSSLVMASIFERYLDRPLLKVSKQFANWVTEKIEH